MTSKNAIKFTFLGTGASAGIPVIGCECKVCRSFSSYNKRSRSAALIETATGKYLIDAGPDFRTQALAHDLKSLKGLIITHAHFDHIAGFDDLKALCFRSFDPLPILLSKETSAHVNRMFSYLFTDLSTGLSSGRFYEYILPELHGKLEFEGLELSYVTYYQAGMSVNGFRIGNLAYLSDIKEFDSAIFNYLQGVETLIISALRHGPSNQHLSINEAILFAKNIAAKKVYMTHISHDLDHDETNDYLPPHVELAYDGLVIEVN